MQAQTNFPLEDRSVSIYVHVPDERLSKSGFREGSFKDRTGQKKARRMDSKSSAPGLMATPRAMPSGLPRMSWMSTSGLEGNPIASDKAGPYHTRWLATTAGIPPATAGYGTIGTP